MAMNTHYSGRMEKAIQRTLKEAAGREGKFYQIFTKYGYYDVNDEQNGLTKEQREQVPIENQTRFTQFANALVEMFEFILADGQYGLITKDMQNIVDKLDIRSSANSAQLNAIGSSLSALATTVILAPFAAVDASRRIAETQTTMAMGSNPFNVDLIPPIAIGLDGLPVSIANVFKAGFFQPNWDFLYQHELVKSNKFYDSGDGKMRIGCNILLDQGGDKRDLFLKNIFAVNTTDKDLQPLGDVKGGVSAEDYEILRTAATTNVSVLSSDDSDATNSKIRAFRLNDSQIQAAFFKYVQLKLWGAINNKKNWAHSHWGALTHNSCPEYVKSAVCSFLWTNGLSIESGKSDESAFISYCLYMGINYLTGYQYSVSMYPIAGVDKILNAEGSVVAVENATNLIPNESGIVIASNGLPKDTSIANQYFTWIADILLRLTASNNSPETDIALRKRRVAEANLIYKGLGHPTVNYGDSLSKLDYFHSEGALKDRKFDKLMSANIFRYANEGSAGGAGINGALIEPSKDAVTIHYDESAKPEVVTDLTLNIVRSLCVQAGVREIYITSTYREPEIQVRAMFNNLQTNNRINYAPPGRNVVDVYDSKKREYGVGYTSPLTDANQIASTKAAMLDAISNAPPEKVSKHSGNPDVVQAIDISPTRMMPLSRKPSFRAVCIQALNDGVLKAFLGPKPDGPGKDPAFHLEIWQNGNGNTSQYSSAPAVNNVLPTVLFSMPNPNLRKSTSWLNPIAKDHVDSVNASNGSEDQA